VQQNVQITYTLYKAVENIIQKSNRLANFLLEALAEIKLLSKKLILMMYS
jgi:predicted RecB family endonuclease